MPSPLLLGIDLGTTTTTAIAVDADTGDVTSKATGSTASPITNRNDHGKGRSEWDANVLIADGMATLTQLVEQLGNRSADVAGIGLTGQQHGMVMVDSDRRPVTPFINWQDQRGNEVIPSRDVSWVTEARDRLGNESPQRTGCRPNTGFMATTLFWMKQNHCLPAGQACFLSDLFSAELTGERPVCEPSMAGSAGVLNVTARDWDHDAIAALELDLAMFPQVREADVPAGVLPESMADKLGLTAGLPVAISIGDHQASFVGSVADRHSSVLLNVGTGAQVAVFTDGNKFDAPIELRPYPIQGNLLSNVGLAGGWSFQVIEKFIRAIGSHVFGVESDAPLYSQLTRLAAAAEPSSGGLVCEPLFSGTRSDPNRRGVLQEMSPQNLTPGNMIRSVIEGMAANHRAAWDKIVAVTRQRQSQLVGAGNGLRENAVLVDAVTSAFQLPPGLARHREEAAFGAALVGGVAAGVFDSLNAATSIIHYEN